MLRGHHTSTAAVQSYNHIFITDVTKVRESWERVLSEEIDVMLLGHGGIVKGDVKGEIQKAYAFTLNGKYAPSFADRMYLRAMYLRRVHLFRGTLSTAWQKLTHKE